MVLIRYLNQLLHLEVGAVLLYTLLLQMLGLPEDREVVLEMPTTLLTAEQAQLDKGMQEVEVQITNHPILVEVEAAPVQLEQQVVAVSQVTRALEHLLI